VGEIGHYAPVKYVRIFADEQGRSHFEDVELDLKRQRVAEGVPPFQLAGPLTASGVVFVEQMGEQGDAAPWERHVTPSRRWIVVLEGELDALLRMASAGCSVLATSSSGRTPPEKGRSRHRVVPASDSS
jgi:hypothetical protein